MSGTIVTSAPRRSSSSASGFASGRVTTMRRPTSGWSATDRRQYAVRADGKCLFGESLAELLRLSLPGNAHHVSSIDRRDETLETHPRGRRRHRERRHRRRAAGAERVEERPLGRRLRACGRVVEAREERAHRRRRRHGTGPRARPGRAPAASSRPRATPSRRPRARAAGRPPRRARPRRTRPSATLRTRVSTFPRIERTSRSGRSAAQLCRSPRRLLVPTTAPPASSASDEPVSRDEAVADVLARGDGADDDARRILRREVLERVHGDDRSRRSRSARSSSAVKRPFPPISGSGSPLACVRSPVVDDHRVSHSSVGPALRSGARRRASVCARASDEARVPSVDRRRHAAGRSPVAAERRCRRDRARRRRPRPRRRRPHARARAPSDRGAASSRAIARDARCARRPPGRRRRGRAAPARPRARGSTRPAGEAPRGEARPRARDSGARTPRPPPRRSPRPSAPRGAVRPSPRRGRRAGRRRRRAGRPSTSPASRSTSAGTARSTRTSGRSGALRHRRSHDLGARRRAPRTRSR